MKKKFGTLVSIAGLMLVASATVSAAQNNTLIGSFSNATLPPLDCSQGTLIQASKRLVAWDKTDVTNVTVPAGVLNVEMYWSWDSYSGRETVTQPNERWRINVNSAVSEWTEDVPDNTFAGLVTDTMEPFITNGGLVTFEHWSVNGDESSPNSVQPLGVCITVDVPVVTTLVTTQPTSSVPVVPSTVVEPTVVDTTIPVNVSTTVETAAPTTVATTSTVPTTVITNTLPTTQLATTTMLVHAPTPNPDPMPTVIPTTVYIEPSPTTVAPVVSSITSTTTVPVRDVVLAVPQTIISEQTTTDLAYTGVDMFVAVYGMMLLILGVGMMMASRSE